MSEYQYYDFIAIDEPLTPKQMAELCACSSRANITATSFVNDYQWGNLEGDPADWMRRYFDVYVYVANWCTCILCLRLPKSAFDAGTLHDFTTETTFSFKQTKTHWLLEWVLSFGRWYNTEHKHSVLKFTTPEQRHTGEATAILKHSQHVYREARARHPSRWSGEIRNWELPEQVWLNPQKEQSEKKNSPS